MATQRLRLLIILSLLLFAGNASAQSEASVKGEQSSSAAVTGAISAEGTIRFTSPGQATQMRLEVYSATGALVYDSGMRQGSVIDWKITDAAQAMSDGSYLCIVSVKDLQGKLRQRFSGLSLLSGQPTLQRATTESLTAQQSQAMAASRQAQKLGAADDSDAITILRQGKQRSVTVTTHDGQDGQVTSTNGSLTLRTGDVFSNQDKEQMRITPDGKVGIGTDKPEATLDVAGTIRARGGIRFEDGTVLNSASGMSTSQTAIVPGNTQNGSTTASAIGTGTQNRLPKWSETGGNGTLVDSLITETPTGFVGINNPNPTSRLQVSASTGAEMRFDQGSGGVTPVLSIVSQPSSITQGGAAILGAGTAGSSFVFTDNFPFHIVKDTKANVINNNLGNGTPLFTMLPSGNVGIGNTNPTAKLEVTGGSLKLSSPGSAIIFPDGTSMTTASAGGGGQMSGNSIITAINDPATVSVINDARLTPNVARLSTANTWVGPNVFNLGISANGALVSNVGNPVNAGDAVNKAYADANYVKFVPGAEQLSVGDANGTATMINLRGGSTCCSGPGGHTPAFFKVFQNGSFVATGNLGIGTSPMEGKGYRTSWHTYKGAFRSGYADNEWDDANTGFFSWAGGSNSTASGLYALAFGDTNFASSTSSIVFGSGNEVKGAAGFAAGAGNRVCDTYGVAFGNNARSGGPYINGRCDPEVFNIRGLAAVAIGYNVTADQDHTTAMGKFASNNGFQGTFIWADGAAQASADTFRNTANNEFAVRATGGVRFRTNLGGTTGCNLPAGSGVFNCTSSRYTKENFLMVNGEDVLSSLRKVPVSTWNYISEGRRVRHMGPMAEDFYKVFGLGTSNTSIGVQDLAGVSLAAVQALEKRTTELQQKTAEVEQLRTEVNELRSANLAMEQRLAALEQNAQKSTRRQPKARRR